MKDAPLDPISNQSLGLACLYCRSATNQVWNKTKRCVIQQSLTANLFRFGRGGGGGGIGEQTWCIFCENNFFGQEFFVRVDVLNDDMRYPWFLNN